MKTGVSTWLCGSFNFATRAFDASQRRLISKVKAFPMAKGARVRGMNPLEKQAASFQASRSRASEILSGKRHINSYVHDIISYLKVRYLLHIFNLKLEARPVILDEISGRFNIPGETLSLIVSKLTQNNRIEMNGRYLSFRPHFDIRSKSDLLNSLKKLPCGIDVNELKEISNIEIFLNV